MEFVENSLVKKARSGDTQAFTELMYLYKDKIYHLAYRMLGNAQEAEDVSQETFLRVYSNLDRYDEKHKFSTWIYRIATNLSIDRIRKKKANFSLDESWNDEEGADWYAKIASNDISPEQQAILSEEQETLHKAILSLPPKYRGIVTLKYVNELSIQEISEIVNLSVPTVKTRLHRGREYLRKYLVKSGSVRERSGQYELS